MSGTDQPKQDAVASAAKATSPPPPSVAEHTAPSPPNNSARLSSTITTKSTISSTKNSKIPTPLKPVVTYTSDPHNTNPDHKVPIINTAQQRPAAAPRPSSTALVASSGELAEFRKWKMERAAEADRKHRDAAGSLADALSKSPASKDLVTEKNEFLIRVHELRRQNPLATEENVKDPKQADEYAILIASMVLMPEAAAKKWAISYQTKPKIGEPERIPVPVNLQECCFAIRYNWPLNPDQSTRDVMVINGMRYFVSGNNIVLIQGIPFCMHNDFNCRNRECFGFNGELTVKGIGIVHTPVGAFNVDVGITPAVRQNLKEVAFEIRRAYDKRNNIKTMRHVKDKATGQVSVLPLPKPLDIEQLKKTSAEFHKGASVLKAAKEDKEEKKKKEQQAPSDKESEIKGEVKAEPVATITNAAATAATKKKKRAIKKQATVQAKAEAAAAEEKADQEAELKKLTCPADPETKKDIVVQWLLESDNEETFVKRMFAINTHGAYPPAWAEEDFYDKTKSPILAWCRKKMEEAGKKEIQGGEALADQFPALGAQFPVLFETGRVAIRVVPEQKQKQKSPSSDEAKKEEVTDQKKDEAVSAAVVSQLDADSTTATQFVRSIASSHHNGSLSLDQGLQPQALKSGKRKAPV